MKTEENIIDQKALDMVTRIIRMVECLPKEGTAEIMGKAIVRSSAAAGIHYAEAEKAKSAREFIRMMRLMQTQLGQTDFWLKMIEGTSYFKPGKLEPLKEANTELIRMVTKSLKTATENQKKLMEQRKKEKAKEVATQG